MEEMYSIPMDRVQPNCRTCPNRTRMNIVAAWISLTRVCLEAKCPACGQINATCFDLLKVDRWIHDSAGAELPEGIDVEMTSRVESPVRPQLWY